MPKVITVMEYQNQLLVEHGVNQGNFEMALKIMDELGIDVAIKISEFSKYELLNSKLN